MKIITYKIPAGCRQAICGLLTLFLLITAGCQKDAKTAQLPVADNNSIKYVLNDNFTFGTFFKALSFVNFQDTLAKLGPYTCLAPDNTAFTTLTAGQNLIFDAKKPVPILNMMRYFTLKGRILFKNQPLLQNKAFLTLTGGNIYVSKYLKGTDTITTINGIKIAASDNLASNGLIQVLPRILTPQVYHKTMDYIHNDTTLTLFSIALQRAKLDVSLLAGSDEYTILAPSNNAFQQSRKLGKNLGVSTLDSILTADPDKLAAFLKYHMMQGRYFEGDLFKYITANPAGITMLNGKNVKVGGSENTYHSVTFLGNGNQTAARLIPYSSFESFNIRADIPFDNGVIHAINQVLIP